MWAFIISEFGPWLIGIAGLLGGVVLAYLKGRGDGKTVERAKSAEQNAKAVQTRKGVEDDVAKMDSDELDSRFNRWVRNDKR